MTSHSDNRRGRPRSESAKRAILRAALDLLKRGGVAGVTAEGVAERAGVSKATLYRWWPCGPAIAMDAFFDDVSAQVADVATSSPIEDLRVRARRVARFLTGKLGDVLAGLIAATHTDPRLAETFRERYLDPSRENLRQVVERAAAGGLLRSDVDPELAMDVICGAFYYRRLVRHLPTSPKTMDEVMTCVLDGLRPRPRAVRGRTVRRRARS